MLKRQMCLLLCCGPLWAQTLGERCLQDLKLSSTETYVVTPRGPLALPSEIDFPGRAGFSKSLPPEAQPKGWPSVKAGPELTKLYSQSEKFAWIYLSEPSLSADRKTAALTFLLADHGQNHCGYALYRRQGEGWKLDRLRKAEGSVATFKN